jgi:methylated-DNA-[protein]-cysteine S-methyltransferase
MIKKSLDRNEFYDFIDSPVGTIYLTFSGRMLTGVAFTRPKGVPLRKTSGSSLAKKELTEYFEEGRRNFSCRTDFTEGTDFEKAVWNALKEVPYGETRTYKWMAEQIGKPNASRAVGQALGKNPLAIVFPCHRIIESDGSLGGYTSGTEIKRRLLEIEYYGRLSKS